jgi:NAD(P)-dependent dehydrogenase (short-subunit alcohol dehydrogenase family)
MLRVMTQTAARNVIISGGTGALGRAVVQAFLDAGDLVWVPWVVAAEAQAMSAHDGLTLLEADVSSSEGASSVVAAAGPVSVLINGVGGFGGGDPIEATDLELWDKLYHLNVRTAVALSRAAIPTLTKSGPGAIINVASQAAIDCPPGIAAYSASKAAIIALTRSLAHELEGTGVRANAVVPTTIDTPANRDAMPDADFSAWTPPSEIARVAYWLASEAAATVSGGLIPV